MTFPNGGGLSPGTGGGGGAVATVFGRAGNVTAQAGDYNSTQLLDKNTAGGFPGLDAAGFILPSEVHDDSMYPAAAEYSMQIDTAQSNAQTLTNGILLFSLFRAQYSLTYNNIGAVTGGTVMAGATLARMGLYSFDASGNATLVAACASDTTLFNTLQTAAERTLVGGAAVTEGGVYGWAVLVVGTTTAPKLWGLPALNTGFTGTFFPGARARAVQINAQTDLQSSYAAAGLSVSGTRMFGWVR